MDQAIEYIDTSNPLKKKVPVRGSGREIDLRAIERAEQALDELSTNFDGWIDEECVHLQEASNQAKAHGLTGDFAQDLFRHAHDLKGQASTLGYPMVGRIADSLCDLLDRHTTERPLPFGLVELHVNAIRVLVRDRVKGEDNDVATTLVSELVSAGRAFAEQSD